MPSFTCKFNRSYEIFLGEVYEYVVSKFAKEFDLSALTEIEIVHSLPGSSDGRMVDNNILLSKRLYDLLPKLDIHDNNDFNLVVSTLYHELCHINERTIMPNIHAVCYEEEKGIDYCVALFWIEYIVETKTDAVFRKDRSQFCHYLAESDWRIDRFNFDDNKTFNYFWLIKILPYVLVAFHNKGISTYTERIKNKLVRNMVSELYNVILDLQKAYPFDDINKLCEIKRVMISYQKQFLE